MNTLFARLTANTHGQHSHNSGRQPRASSRRSGLSIALVALLILRTNCDSCMPLDATPEWWNVPDCLVVLPTNSLHDEFLLLAPAMPRAKRLARWT